MFCKYCGAELEQEKTLCPACGKDNAEDIPQPKSKADTPKMTLHIIACVLLFFTLAAIVFVGAGGDMESIAKLFRKRENNIFYKESYTVSAEKLSADKVVATAGNKQLTNGQLQIYYWMQVYEFIEYTGGYPSYYGLDTSKPLDEQVVDKETGQTWQQYFIENALNAWRRYVALCAKAEDAGYKMPDDYQETLDKLYETLTEEAKGKKFDTVEAMLTHDLGAGANFDNYKSYLSSYYLGNLYFSDLGKNIVITQAELEAFFEEHGLEAEESYDITKKSGNMTDVRHLLIKPKGGTLSEDGTTTTYSEAEWEACRKAAQDLLDQWLAGEATEETFTELVKEKTEDTGSKETGGLYSNVYQSGQYVPEFEAWCIDSARKAGDYGLVKTDYGYHIMYCVNSEAAWIRYSRDAVMGEKSTAMLNAMDAEYPMEVTYKLIAIPAVTFGS